MWELCLCVFVRLTAHLKGKYSGLFQETPLFSPVFANLPSVKPDTLFGVSAEKQELRRKLLRGSNVLIVQGGYSGKRFIYEKLKALGIKVTIMDGPDSVWKQAVEEGLIEYFVELDFTDYETVLERALDQIMELDVSFDGVTTYFENAVPLAARIATALGVETNPPEVSFSTHTIISVSPVDDHPILNSHLFSQSRRHATRREARV